MSKKNRTIKERLASARLPETTLEVCLRGDLKAKHERLVRELQRVRTTENQSLADNGELALAEQVQAVEAEMAEESITLTFKALPRSKWAELVERYPARDQENDPLNVHLAPLMEEAVPACLVDFDPDDWAALSDVICDGDYQAILEKVWQVNRGGTSVPLSQSASRIIQQHSDKHEQPEPTGSPSASI